MRARYFDGVLAASSKSNSRNSFGGVAKRLSVAYLSLLLVEESARVLVLDSVLVREGLGRDLLIGDRVVGSRLKIKKQDAKGQVIKGRDEG